MPNDQVWNTICFPLEKYLDFYVYWILFLSYNVFSILAMSSSRYFIKSKRNRNSRGSWVALSVKHLTLVQVMISQFMGLSPVPHDLCPTFGLCADSLEPGPCFGFCLPLSLLVLCLSPSKINKTLKKKKETEILG